MPSSSDQLEEIKNLISSNSKQSKSFGYCSLFRFQEQSSNIPSSIQALVQCSRCIIASVIPDIFEDDEEIAAQALKCLGFIIYHPSLIATISVDGASLVLQSLTKLIMTTKMKSVCNLGVWCISIQQLDTSFLAVHFDSLLRAVVHALDNPFGSLSTTFEAIQAVMKLAAQLSENMRELSHIWVPAICKRLLSIDKKERDMSERCMLKIKSTIFPPTLGLSKAIVEDMKQKYLSKMKDLINEGMKVQTIQAWGWYIRLLGSYVMKKNRHLINDMLKVPELTFPDNNAQVQIASLVAWEGLIDRLINLPILPCNTNRDLDNGNPRGNVHVHDIQENASIKSIKLIMTPLIGIISSKCEVTVHSSCLRTWFYLLYKLDTSINCPSVMKLVLDPILEAVFQTGPGGKNTWLWNLCLELLDDFILVKFKDVHCDKNDQVACHLSPRSSVLGLPISGKCSWRHPIKWLPWDLSQLDFFLKIINIITCHVSMGKVSFEDRNLACDAALRMFRSVLKAVQMEFRDLSNDYNDITLSLNSLLQFTTKVCEDLSSEQSGSNGMHHACLTYIEAITEELETSILGSSPYKVELDVKYVKNLPSYNDIRHTKVLGISSITYMDMVSPIVYLIVVYIYVLVQSLNTPKVEFILRHSHKFFKFVFSSYDPREVLMATLGLLYKNITYGHLEIWIVIAVGLKDWMDSLMDLSFLKVEFDSNFYLAICHLLSYPLVVCSRHLQNSTSIKVRSLSVESFASSRRKLDQVMEFWKSFYCFLTTSKLEYFTSSFPEDLCAVLNGFLDSSTNMFEGVTEIDLSCEDMDLNLSCLLADVVGCILEHIMTSEVISCSSTKKHDSCSKISGSVSNILGLAARFLRFSGMKIGAKSLTGPQTSRVFSSLARYVGCLQSQQNIISFFKIISCSLLQWLSHVQLQDQTTKDQLQLLWAETLISLQRSQPPIIFNSSFLKLQACLLEQTLDHPSSSISEPTIGFWNSAYGKQVALDYPQNLLHILDKLSRNGRINLHTRKQSSLKRCHSAIEDINSMQRYKVTTTYNRSSKRVEVELLKETTVNILQEDKQSLNARRKSIELTDHQKEVRRAQQGKERDCSAHGPGIRTYTSVDFSQGNEESQESQDNENLKSILEMSRTLA